MTICKTREAAHKAATAAYAQAQGIIASGKVARIVCEVYEVDRTLQQNRYYWGPCLREISEQATIDGHKYTAEAWHELFRRQFLGYEIERVEVAGCRVPEMVHRVKSTAKLKVGEMSEYLDKVQAFGADELGVRFSCASWQEHK